MYSLYELYLHFIGCLIHIEDSSVTIEELENKKKRSSYINVFKSRYENDNAWRIFYEFVPSILNGDVNKKREARNIDVHENALLKNGEFKGWYVSKCLINEKKFKSIRNLLTLLLLKVSECLSIFPDDDFYDEFIKI